MRRSGMHAGLGVIALALVCAAGARPAGEQAETKVAAKPATREVVDETGRRVSVPVDVRRIVALAPNLTEIIYALGAEDRLVGVSDYTERPAAAKEKPSVGTQTNPSLETIVGMRPDVVLMAAVNRWETERELEHLGIAVYGTDPHNVAETLKSIEDVGDVIGAAAEAKALVAKLQAKLNALQAKLANVPRTRVLFVVWQEPLISVGEHTFIADALRDAGAESVVRTAQDWPQISLEEIVKLQPEYLVYASGEVETGPDAQATEQEAVEKKVRELRGEAGWRGLAAVKAGRVAVISDEVNMPAPGLIGAIEQLARELHPGAFAAEAHVGDTKPAANSAKLSHFLIAQNKKFSKGELRCGR